MSLNSQKSTKYASLRLAIKEAGYNQKSLAEAINICKSSLSMKLNCLYEFSEGEIQKICEVIKVNPCEVFFDGKFRESEQKTKNKRGKRQ